MTKRNADLLGNKNNSVVSREHISKQTLRFLGVFVAVVTGLFVCCCWVFPFCWFVCCSFWGGRVLFCFCFLWAKDVFRRLVPLKWVWVNTQAQGSLETWKADV